MRTKVVLLVSGLCVLSAAVSFAQSTNTQAGSLESLKLSYEKTIAKIESDYTIDMQGMPTTYLNDLQKLQQTLQKAGDLDGFTAVGKEMERFKNEQTIPEEPDAALIEKITLLRTKYRENLAKLALDKDTKIVAAAKQYIDRLTALQKSLTMAGKIDDALAVNVEIKEAGSNPKVRDAEFSIASHEADSKKGSARTSKPDSSPKPKPQSSETPKSPDKQKDAKSKPPSSASGEIISGKGESVSTEIYEGKPFPKEPGDAYKNLTLSVTDHSSSIASKMNISAMLDTESNMDKRQSIYWSRIRWKEGTMVYALRATVKSINKSYVLDGGKMLVQYYGKDSTEAGKITPQVVDTKTVSLPKIDGNRAVGIDFSPCTMEVSKSRFGGRYYYYGGSDSGQTLYGVIITIFDSSGALVYQVGSNNTLKKFGATRLP